MAKILTIIPYAFYPPQNGGSLRCFYILREMARNHEVYLLTVQPEADFNAAAEPAFPRNVTVISLSNSRPYRSIFNILPGKPADAVNYRFLKRKIRTTTDSYFLKAYPVIVHELKKIRPSIVFFENLEVAGHFSDLVKKHFPEARQVYDAHNIDSELWTQLAAAQQNTLFKTYANAALATEKKLYKMVDAVFCCSEQDRQKLAELNGGKLQPVIIPNGVDSVAKAPVPAENESPGTEILFCGSLEYYPNEEGLLWFYYNVFPLIKMHIPEAVLTMVGTEKPGGGYKVLGDDPSVNFEGRVADVKPYYLKASVCIAPLLSGSGTRLKILEAMSFGKPVVSTAVGAEGIEAIPGKHLLVENDPAGFADHIVSLLRNRTLYDHISKEARKLVQQHYDWEKIGAIINHNLEITEQRRRVPHKFKM